MCRFYSAIVTKNGDLLHNQSLMSHEDIIDMFELNDTNPNCDNFVRVEFSPKDNNDSVNIEKYFLSVDEKILPLWFEQYREYVTSRLKDFVNKRIILTNKKILSDGIYIVGENIVIDKLVNGSIIDLFGTVQNVCGGTVQNVCGGTVQNVCDGGTVQNVCDGTVQNVYGGTVQNVCDGGTVQNVWSSGTVQNVYDGGTVQNVLGGGTVQNVLDGGVVNGVKK